MISESELMDAREEAFDAVWYLRTIHGGRIDAEAMPYVEELRKLRPALISELDESQWMLSRWEGRLATLRWVLDGRDDWAGEGAFDS